MLSCMLRIYLPTPNDLAPLFVYNAAFSSHILRNPVIQENEVSHQYSIFSFGGFPNQERRSTYKRLAPNLFRIQISPGCDVPRRPLLWEPNCAPLCSNLSISFYGVTSQNVLDAKCWRMTHWASIPWFRIRVTMQYGARNVDIKEVIPFLRFVQTLDNNQTSCGVVI